MALVSASHALTFRPGTKVMTGADVVLTDAAGATWTQRVEPVGSPWWPHPIGYGAGSWRDGGSMASYPGTDDVVVEYDEFDWSDQPFAHTTYDGRTLPRVRARPAASDRR